MRQVALKRYIVLDAAREEVRRSRVARGGASRRRVRSDHFDAMRETAAAPPLSIVASVTAMHNKKILVADVPELDARLAAVLDGRELHFVRTVGQAMRALAQQDFELLVISVHFDDSRMFDLLREARSEARNQGIPIVCVREPGHGFTAISGHTLEVTCRALDANLFLDLAALNDDAQRAAALRAAIEGLLPKGD
jgi:PleD family two-component response regulator